MILLDLSFLDSCVGVLWTVHIENKYEKERWERVMCSRAAIVLQRLRKRGGKGSVTLWRSTILLWVRFGCLSTGECYGYGWILMGYARKIETSCWWYILCILLYLCLYVHYTMWLHCLLLSLHLYWSSVMHVSPIPHTHTSYIAYYIHIAFTIHHSHHTYMTYIIHHIYHCIHTNYTSHLYLYAVLVLILL